MALYKYFDKTRIADALAALTLRFTQPTALNDPFEMSPVLEDLTSTAKLRTYLESELLPGVILQKYAQLSDYQRSGISLEQFAHELQPSATATIGEVERLGPAIAEGLAREAPCRRSDGTTPAHVAAARSTRTAT
jgi:hypothetical protein